MLKAIVFDMDGVIIDSHPVHREAWKNFLFSLGRRVSETDLDFILEGWRREDILRHFFGKISEDQITEYGNRKDEFFRKVGLPVRTVPGLPEFLAHLEDRRILKAVATSASEKRTYSTIGQLQLTRYFTAIVTGNDVPHGKPDPAIYLMAAELMNVHSKDVVAFEDSVSGVKAAKAAGMRCLGIADDARSEMLRVAGADYIIPNFVGMTLDRLEWLLVSLSSEDESEKVQTVSRRPHRA